MTKLISLTDEVYKMLLSIKEEKESFSKLIYRLVSFIRRENRNGLLSFAGSFSKYGKKSRMAFAKARKLREASLVTKVKL